MKKKLTLILTLVLALVAMFSIGTIGVVAESSNDFNITGNVSVNDISVTKGTEKVSISYKLILSDGREIENFTLPIQVEVDGKYEDQDVEPYIELYEADKVTKLANSTLGTITTKQMEVGEKTIVAKFFYREGGVLYSEATFKLTIVKQDNTMTIVMIVLIVLIVGYLIWSNYSSKKKQKKAQSQASELKIGDRVKTIGGVCGFVSEINDAENTFTLEVGANSFVKFDKGAIYQTAPAQGSAVAKEEGKEENAEKPEEKKEEK